MAWLVKALTAKAGDPGIYMMKKRTGFCKLSSPPHMHPGTCMLLHTHAHALNKLIKCKKKV